MLALADTPPTDPTIPPPPSPVIQQVEIRAISTWHLIAAGAITGFAIALGTALFAKGARRIGVEPELHGSRHR